VKKSSALSKVDNEKVKVVSTHVDGLVKSFVPQAESLSDVGAEQSFRLPFSASHQFVSMFGALDMKRDELSIAEYGISVTTLEEVFIRVGEIEHQEEKAVGGELKQEAHGNNRQMNNDNVVKAFDASDHSQPNNDAQSNQVDTHIVEGKLFIENLNGNIS
jgi:hypothetical protein